MAKPNILRILSAPTKSNKAMLLIMVVVIVTIMFDVSIARVYDLMVKEASSVWKIVLITSICVIGQYFILRYVEHKSAGIRGVEKLRIRTLHQAVRISQLTVTAILVFLILQTVLTLRYNTLLVIMIAWISYGLTIVMLGLLAQRFFSWFIANKNLVIILYALASASLSVNAIFALAYVNDILVDRPEEMMPMFGGSMVTILPNSTTAVLNSGFFVSSIVSFVLLWSATAALLHHYSLKIGKLRYWMIIASPLMFFLGQFASLFIRLFDPLLALDAVSYAFWITLVFTLSKPVGGILFGIAFYTIARNFRQNVVLRNYLIISAFGFMLLFVANQASVLLITLFPPFGVPSISFVGLASYLILLGIYSSVISISEDVKLRRLLRKTALDRSKLLDNMTSAHIKEEIHKKAVSIMKDNSDKLAEVTGLESLHSENDMKQYVDEVMKEMQRTGKSSTSAKDKDEEK